MCSSLAVTTPSLGIAILPPELMANNDHVHRAGRFGNSLGSKDDPRGRQKQHDDDQDRNHRPRKLNLVAAVDLRRFPIRVRPGVCRKRDQRIQQQAGDNQKDGQG